VLYIDSDVFYIIKHFVEVVENNIIDDLLVAMTR